MSEPAAKGVQEAQFFEDFAKGARYRCGPVAVRDDTILAFARLYDPQPFHTDPDHASKTIFGGLISSGWQALSETFAKSVEDGFLRGGGLSSEGMEDLRWLKPVRPGDAIHLQFDVVDAVSDDARTDRGQVTFDVSALNQKDEVVMSYRLHAIIRRRMS
jgi:acyl dehydratase